MNEQMNSIQKYRILFHEQQYCRLPEATRTEENWRAWLDSLPDTESAPLRNFEVFMSSEMERSYRRFVLETKGILMDEYMKKKLSEDDYTVWNKREQSSRQHQLNPGALIPKDHSNSFKNADLLIQNIKQKCSMILKVAEGKNDCLGSAPSDLIWRCFLTEYSGYIGEILTLDYHFRGSKSPALSPKTFVLNYKTLDFKFFLRRFSELCREIDKLENMVRGIHIELDSGSKHRFSGWENKITEISSSIKKGIATLEAYLL